MAAILRTFKGATPETANTIVNPSSLTDMELLQATSLEVTRATVIREFPLPKGCVAKWRLIHGHDGVEEVGVEVTFPDGRVTLVHPSREWKDKTFLQGSLTFGVLDPLFVKEGQSASVAFVTTKLRNNNPKTWWVYKAPPTRAPRSDKKRAE